MIRTHDAGTLRASDAGHIVTLAGWVASRRDHGGVAFIDLRDASGIVQVVVRDDEIAHDLRNEWCIVVTGEVRRRLEGNVNPRIATGEIEVVASRVVPSGVTQAMRYSTCVARESARLSQYMTASPAVASMPAAQLLP